MDLEKAGKEWNEFGKKDPFWAILVEEDKLGGKWNSAEFFATGLKEINSELLILKNENINVKFRSAMDFGCGIGRLTHALSTHFDHVYGVDIAPSMIQKANELNLNPKKCKFILNEKNDLSIFKNSSLDFIYTCRVLQHIEPKYTLNYLKEFSRILKPGGVLIFQLPDKTRVCLHSIVEQVMPRSMFNFIKRVIAPYGLIMEMYPVRKEKIVAFLSQSNFRIVKMLKDNKAGPGYTSFTYFCQKN